MIAPSRHIRAVAKAGVYLVLYRETYFEGHLPVVHLPVVDTAASFDDLEPTEILDCL